MKKITKISTQRRKGYYNIFLDEKYAFSVSERILTDRMLAKGQELTAAEIKELTTASSVDKAREQALNYLSYQPRSIKEVEQYLVKEEITEEMIAAIIADLISYGYLDDQNYAKLFVGNAVRVGNDGPRNVLNKLLRKGVNPDLAADAVSEIENSAWVTVGERVLKPLYKKATRLANQDVVNKMRQKLMQHGFEAGQIQELLEQVEFDEDDETALRLQGIKAYKKFRKYDERTRNQKIRIYLYQHGFDQTQIQSFLAGEVIDLAEIENY